MDPEIKILKNKIYKVCICVFGVAAFSFIIAMISMRNMEPTAYSIMDSASIASFVIMIIFGLLMLLKSRVVAVFLVIYFILSRIILFSMVAFSNMTITIDFYIGAAFIVVFCYGVHLTFYYQRKKKALQKNP